VEVIEILFSAEAAVDSVTEFVGEGSDIGEVAEVGHEDDGVGVGGVIAAEGSAGFSGSRLSVYPIFVKEFFGTLS